MNDCSKTKTSARQIIDFLRNPNYDYCEDDFWAKIKNSIKAYLLFLIPAIIAILIKRIFDFRMIDEIEFIALEETNMTHWDAILVNITFLSVVAVYEELEIRLMIGKFRLRFVSASLSMLLGSLLYYFIWKNLDGLLYIPAPFTHYFHMFLLSIPFYPILYFGLLNFREIGKIWNNNSGLIYYLSAMIFAIMHFNFLKHQPAEYIHIPIMVLPQFILGLCFGYIRIKYGFIYAIIIHFINNLPALAFTIVLIVLSM
jgi:hypothetical protein